MDSIDAIATRLNIYKLITPLSFASPLTGIIHSQLVFVNEVINSLNTKENLFPKLISIRNLETEGDSVFCEALANLFENEENVHELIKKKEILENMERTVDRCQTIVWTYLCTHYGFPISVSHALIGGLSGAAVMKAGFRALVASGLIKVTIFIFLSPIIGLLLGILLMITVSWIFKNSNNQKVDKVFRIGQLVSSAAFSPGHGTNDAQKTMGIIAILLYSAGYLGNEFYVPFWVIISAHTAIGLGTLAGRWKVIRTMGMRLTHLKPVGEFCAETAGALVLVGTAFAGIPVSTTHTISGSIMGVGAVKRITAVRWGIAGKIIWAWILTFLCLRFAVPFVTFL